MQKEPMKSNFKKALAAQHNAGFRAGYEKGYAKGRNNGICTAVENYSSVVLFCMANKFDYDNEELKIVTAAINEIFHDVCEGCLTFDDIREAMIKENHLEISFDGGDVALKETIDDESLQVT